MLECKLWYSETATKNVKGKKMVEFMKTCDQYPHKFNFDHFLSSFPVGIYLLKVNNKNTRTRCEICSKLTIKTPERRSSHWVHSSVPYFMLGE